MSKGISLSRRSAAFMNLCLLLFAAAFALTACTENAQPQSVKNVPATPTPQQPQTAAATPAEARPDAAPSATPPPLADAQGALARVYHDAVTLQTSRDTPFVVGDFNGDGSQDIALVVTPAKGKLPQINSEFASWLVGDPQTVKASEVRGDVKVFPKRPEPVVVQQDDVLLAVIHGYQKDGWRNRLAAQTFLLRNAVGDGMRTRSAEGVMNSTADRAGLPQLRGDVIGEALAGEVGFIYWTGAKYAWAAPDAHKQQ